MTTIEAPIQEEKANVTAENTNTNPAENKAPESKKENTEAPEETEITTVTNEEEKAEEKETDTAAKA